MLLAFANIRLGVWLPNPRYVQRLDPGACAPGYPRTGLGYLFKEFFGIHDLTDPFLYVTDGGHWENTGLVEMLRRSDMREVVCIDADSGPGDAVSSLGKALDLAPQECDVKVWINLDPLRAKASGSRFPDYAERTVNIGFFTRGADDTEAGVLWYSKPGLAMDMPQHLLAFRETHADYPHVSTVDQFFDTASFVAYRGLGRYNAKEILKARAVLVAELGVLVHMTEDQIDARFKAAQEGLSYPGTLRAPWRTRPPPQSPVERLRRVSSLRTDLIGRAEFGSSLAQQPRCSAKWGPATSAWSGCGRACLLGGTLRNRPCCPWFGVLLIAVDVIPSYYVTWGLPEM